MTFECDANNMKAQKDSLLHFPPIETHLIRSRHVAQTFKIQVMQPGRRAGDTRRFPVVYATDGNWTFDMFKSISYLLQMSALDSPPFILVGIGYPSDFPHAGYMLRMRDLSAPPFPRWEKWEKNWHDCMMVPYIEGVLEPEEGTKNFYGGENFRSFIGTELLPFIDEKYQTLAGERTYFGHSQGGFFGLFTLFTQSHLFKNYIVSSPGVVCHGEANFGGRYDNHEFGVQMVRDFAATGRALAGVKLYLSVGADEEHEPVLAPYQMTSGLERLVKAVKLAAIPGLELMSEIFPGETHKTVWPIAFTHGVQAMLGTRRVHRSVYF